MREATATLWHHDCIQGMWDRLDENSVHLTITSIPFEELFTYSGSPEDVGNNGSTIDIRAGRFALNMRFVVEQLFRVTAPGCNVCIHIQQLLAYKVQHGFMGRRDFNGAMRDVFRAGGFHFIGEFVIQKNPQAMAQRQQLHSLMFVTGKRNANMLAPCPNDYVLIFQKPGEVQHPVRAIYSDYADKMTREEWAVSQGYEGTVNGEPYLGTDEEYAAYVKWWKDSKRDPRIARTHNTAGWLSTEEWIRDAHGIWTDIQETDVLDGWKSARETNEERHVCPLQLQVVYRLLRLYSNPVSIQPDVLVLDPFMGIGTTAAMCLGMECHDGYLPINQHRNVVGFELKDSYYRLSLRNVEKTRKMALAREKAKRPLFKELA